MLILGIETATEQVSVAIGGHEGVLAMWQGMVSCLIFTFVCATIDWALIWLFSLLQPAFVSTFISAAIQQIEALPADIVARIGQIAGADSNIPALLDREVDKLLGVDARLGRTGARQAIAAVVGPPGAGKTTCLVKLAAQYGLATRRPTQILTLDTYRVAAAEQLRSYAAILGIGFQVVETPLALAQALEEHRQKDLILIDTPGFGKHDMEDASDLAKFFAAYADIDTHLVLPASMKSADLQRTAAAYRKFHPAKLMFTKLDETSTFGPILNLVVSLGKPVSFLSYGQQIPEDFEGAEKSTLIELILRKESLEENLHSAVAAA